MGKVEELRVTEAGTALVVRDSDKFKKSNELIGAKYKSTLLENRILALSLSKVNQMRAETVTINGENVKVFTSEIKSNELKKQLNISSKNLPTQVKAAYSNMSTRQIGIENENGEFKYRTLIIGGDYVNGTLKLYYNPLLSGYYKEVSKNYTMMSLGTLLSLKSNHSFRLYELIKKECYTTKAQKKIESDKIIYEVPFEVAELKFSLGVVNSTETAVQKVLNKAGAPDYEEAVNRAKEKGFEKWAEFRRRCIDPAVKEINGLEEFKLSYEVEKSGQGGKVQSITFFVEYKNKDNPVAKTKAEAERSQEEIEDFCDRIAELIPVRLKIREYRAISEASGWDFEKILRNYEYSKTKDVEDIVGFMIKAVKEDWAASGKKPQKKAMTEKNGFSDFKGRNDYDFEELMATTINS